MAARHSRAVRQLASAARRIESCPGGIGPISLGVKQMGARSAVNPHAACDVAGTGNVARSKGLPARQSSTLPVGKAPRRRVHSLSGIAAIADADCRHLGSSSVTQRIKCSQVPRTLLVLSRSFKSVCSRRRRPQLDALPHTVDSPCEEAWMVAYNLVLVSLHG